MKYVSGTTTFLLRQESAVSLGKFDGIHLGHQQLLRRIKDISKNKYLSVIFTFDIPPKPDKLKEIQSVLTTNLERRLFLEQMELDYLIECPFVPEIAHMAPEEFINRVLVQELRAKSVVVGEDFRFGYQRQGDYRLLEQLSGRYAYTLEVVEKEKEDGREISSTWVREALLDGNMGLVKRLLGRPYSIIGRVQHGRKIGRTLGTPTTNLIPEENKLLPPNGVYASVTKWKGQAYCGITNIGNKPTIGEKIQKGVETYLFDFNKDLYGEELEIELHQFERREIKFSSLEILKEQMHKDILFGRHYFEKNVKSIESFDEI